MDWTSLSSPGAPQKAQDGSGQVSASTFMVGPEQHLAVCDTRLRTLRHPEGRDWKQASPAVLVVESDSPWLDLGWRPGSITAQVLSARVGLTGAERQDSKTRIFSNAS